jgi:hypothetical protein
MEIPKGIIIGKSAHNRKKDCSGRTDNLPLTRGFYQQVIKSET